MGFSGDTLEMVGMETQHWLMMFLPNRWHVQHGKLRRRPRDNDGKR